MMPENKGMHFTELMREKQKEIVYKFIELIKGKIK
jgi:hypothetical protein